MDGVLLHNLRYVGFNPEGNFGDLLARRVAATSLFDRLFWIAGVGGAVAAPTRLDEVGLKLAGLHMTDAEIEAWIRAKAETIYHPVGTCKMGPDNDPMAVVDNQCRVKGVKGLRVVDASVMPTLVGGNTNAPTIMMAERIASVIQDEAGLQKIAA